MAEMRDLADAVSELAKAQQVIESIKANDALASRVVQLAQLLRKNLAADNINCNCGAARFDPLSDPALRG